jgi:hypothetical protein
MGVFDIDNKITPQWLQDNNWIKTPSLVSSRNPWWNKHFNGMSSNGGTFEITFAYNDEDGTVLYMRGFPYPSITTVSICDIELFIKNQLEGHRKIQYMGRTYFMEQKN